MGFDPTTKNLPATVLIVAKSSVGENAGRGLFASDVIPEGCTIALGEQVQSFHLPPSGTAVMEIMSETDYKNYTDYDGFLTFFMVRILCRCMAEFLLYFLTPVL